MNALALARAHASLSLSPQSIVLEVHCDGLASLRQCVVVLLLLRRRLAVERVRLLNLVSPIFKWGAQSLDASTPLACFEARRVVGAAAAAAEVEDGVVGGSRGVPWCEERPLPEDKRKQLYGPVSKALAQYMMGMVPGA